MSGRGLRTRRRHPDDRDRVAESFSRAVENPAATVGVEYRFRHDDGSWRWLESQSSNQLANPSIGGIVVSSRDVTDRKERERELQETTKTLESIIEGGRYPPHFGVTSKVSSSARNHRTSAQVTGIAQSAA